MKIKTLRAALAVGAIAAASAYAVPASAAFSFTEVAAFAGGVGSATPALSIDYTRPAPTCGGSDLFVPAGTPCVAADVPAPSSADPLFQRMSWLKGTSPQSDLILTNPAAMTALPVGVFTTITTLTQDNRIIPGPLSWNDQSILGRLKIFDGATKVLDNTVTAKASFVETDNAGFTGSPQVPDPSKCGTPNPLGSQCDDHFIFSGGSLASQMFMAADGSQWLAEFQLANFVNAGFDAGGPANGIVYTAEDSTASFDVQVRITPKTTTTVPEPSTLALAGLGLLGLGFACRRRKDRATA